MLLVESTFEIIAPKADAFAKDFYRRLFALHPEIEFLFTVGYARTGRAPLDETVTFIDG